MSVRHPEEPEGAHDEIHLPGPSWWPLTLALGIAFLLSGLILSPLLIALGALISLASFGLWVRDARREYRALHD
ncbi:MAG TPA: hypothetical protein VET65_07240 [Candidatus Limnocylindrales bacterium]|nr:hypothetical protein [Candidatus Limnocylindrales bacterium]